MITAPMAISQVRIPKMAPIVPNVLGLIRPAA